MDEEMNLEEYQELLRNKESAPGRSSYDQLKRQRAGVKGEDRGARALRELGVELVEKIETPKILHRGRLKYTGKVSGDRRGVLAPNGRSVHAEVKSRDSKNLPYSALKPHQREWLTRHAEIGGISLLIWVTPGAVYVMEWGVDGIPGYMVERSSITPELAEFHHLESLEGKR